MARTGVRVNFVRNVPGEKVSAEHDFVIGADGVRSRVRSQLLGVHQPIYRGYTIWRGLARLVGAVPSGSNSETWGRGKRFGILNTGGDRFTWYATANTDPGHVDSSEGRQGELLRMFAGWHEPIERLIGATDESSILKNGAYDLAPLKRWGYGRIMLLGDAAHPCTPNLGLGGCMALEDALVLAKSFCIRGFSRISSAPLRIAAPRANSPCAATLASNGPNRAMGESARRGRTPDGDEYASARDF